MATMALTIRIDPADIHSLHSALISHELALSQPHADAIARHLPLTETAERDIARARRFGWMADQVSDIARVGKLIG